MKTLSDLMRAPGSLDCSSFGKYKAVILAILLFAWPVAITQAHSAVITTQKKKATQKTTGHYTCPMHPEVKSTKNSKCPKCGMALRLAKHDTASASTAGSHASLAGNYAARDGMVATQPVNAIDEHGTIRMVIPDVAVLDQEGNRLGFYTDLVKGKTIAINFIFTTCTTICPPLAATFARVQKQMGDKVGRDVHLISISVDPVTDTPERLKTWGAKFKAGPGWTFVTGGKQEIDKLLNALGASVARREDHSPAVIIGNDVSGEWMRTYGLANPSKLVQLILKVASKAEEQVTKEEVHKQ